MDINKLKAGLAGKIDSYEKYYDAVKASGIPYPDEAIDYLPSSMRYAARYEFTYDWYANDQPIRPLKNKGTSWWFMREQLRIATGVYPAATTVLQQCVDTMRLQVWCIHCSTDPETPEAVAYTPDATAGAADRQVKVGSLAKLLRKLVPLLSDEWLQKIEAFHRAELDPSFELATSVEDVQFVYQNMEGDSGCMRYDHSRWELPNHLHPSHVYANVPGMGVAYHRNGNGVIVSRALVWEDASGTKKYLRVYGDGALKRKLERSGYVNASLAGARIRAVTYDYRGETRHVVPYLDGIAGDQNNYDGTYGFVDMAEPGFIRLIDTEMANRLDTAGITATRFKNHTDVSYKLQPQDLSALRFTCPLSGVVVDKLTNRDTTAAVWLGGRVQNVLVTSYVIRRFGGYARARTYDENGVVRQVWAESWVPTFTWADYSYIETDENRAKLGYVRLDEKLYPGRGWVQLTSTVEVDGQRRLKSDVVTVYEANGTVSHMLRADIVSRKARAEIREKGYHFVGTGDSAYIIHGEHANAVTLRGGRVVHVDRHDVVELHDGTLDFKSNTRIVPLFGRGVRIGKGETLPTSSPSTAWGAALGATYSRYKVDPQAYFRKKAAEWISSYSAEGRGKLVAWLERNLSRATYYGVRGSSLSFMCSDGVFREYRYAHQSLDTEIRPSCAAWAALTPEQRGDIAGGRIEEAECYFGIMTEMLALVDALLAEFDRQVAEKQAQQEAARAAAEARARELMAQATIDESATIPAEVWPGMGNLVATRTYNAETHASVVATAQAVDAALEQLRQQAIAAGLNPDAYQLAA